MSANAGPRADIYSRVTSKIISDLENGVRTWLKPWSVQHTAGRITRPLRATGQPYNGINILMLWADAVSKGFVCPIWMTFRQASEFGANVRKGEHGSNVVYADRITRTETNAKGEDVETAIPFLKGYTVFNCEQIEGLPAHFYPSPPPVAAMPERISAAETFAANTHAEIRLGGNRA
jgi:antirestriction protein ArdC